MSSHPHILIIGHDPLLAEEFEAAIAAMRAYRPVLRLVGDARQAVEAARSWRPQLALMNVDSDLGPLKDLAREVRAIAPETAVVGVFKPDVFAQDTQESMVMLGAFRAGVRDFLRRPVSSSDLAELMDRLLSPVDRAPARIGKIISFVSNKGGVGKSMLAVNTACGLAMRNREEVLLIDASLQLGTCGSLLDLRPATTLTDVARQHGRLDETLVRQLAVPHHSGLHLLAAPVDPVEATEVNDEVLSRLLTLARRTYRYVIVDTFPLVDSLVVAAVDVSDRVYIVVENVVPTLLGVSRFVDILNKLGLPAERQHLVLNRYQHIAGNPQRGQVALRLGRSVDHVVPFDRRVIMAANLGEPYLLRSSRFRAANRSIARIVREIELAGDAPVPSVPAPHANGLAPMNLELDTPPEELPDAGS